MKKVIKKVLRPLYIFLLSAYNGIRMRYDYKKYIKRRAEIFSSIQKKNSIRIVFFVYSIGMWKNDELFRLLLENSHFEPHIIPMFVKTDSDSASRDNQNFIKSYCASRSFPFIELYDFENGEWFDLIHFQPDIVLFQQPYGSGYKGYDIKDLWNSCLFYYIPYNMVMEKKAAFVNTLLCNISLKVFAPSPYHLEQWSKLMLNHGINLVPTGFLTIDYLTNQKYNNDRKWKLKNPDIKKVIWAPHHSIFEKGILHYSNFLELAIGMKELAAQYNGVVQFAFKPHPRLRSSLERHPDWGKKKTDNYYEWWENSSNTTFVDGEYYDLFLSSDAMIHDCSTFMAEYLYTNNPVMFIRKPNYKMPLNSFAENCLRHHYQGRTIKDIKDFIDKVVINGEDCMKTARIQFINSISLKPKDSTVAYKIYEEICSDLS